MYKRQVALNKCHFTERRRTLLQLLEIVGRRCTTIVIAHRLSTVKKCDLIYEMENGKIIASGDFQQLQERSASFREMALIEGD